MPLSPSRQTLLSPPSHCFGSIDDECTGTCSGLPDTQHRTRDFWDTIKSNGPPTPVSCNIDRVWVILDNRLHNLQVSVWRHSTDLNGILYDGLSEWQTQTSSMGPWTHTYVSRSPFLHTQGPVVKLHVNQVIEHHGGFGRKCQPMSLDLIFFFRHVVILIHYMNDRLRSKGHVW